LDKKAPVILKKKLESIYCNYLINWKHLIMFSIY
jgi:hypothetical protein